MAEKESVRIQESECAKCRYANSHQKALSTAIAMPIHTELWLLNLESLRLSILNASSRLSSGSMRAEKEFILTENRRFMERVFYHAENASELKMSTPPIQWYPGHIAKAEKALLEQLKRVDVVLEVRDARIPLSTAHPQVSQWLGTRGRVLVMNRLDMIPSMVRQQWIEWFETQEEPLYFTDAQHGKGIEAVLHAAQIAGSQMNQRRSDRGMLPRPVRAVVIGFPNVGKSALINRLLNRRVVESARRAGITRQLRWVRISDQIELLDAPGVLPSRLHDQEAALKLAICDDIGEAAYDNQRVATELVALLKKLDQAFALQLRYGLDPAPITSEDYLYNLAEKRHQGDRERTARQILNDFRKGTLGAIALELPPASSH